MAERPRITMTDEEARAYVAAADEVVVGAIGPRGWPVATLARAGVDDADITIHLTSDDMMAAVMAEGVYVCCVADQGTSYFDIKGVVARGVVDRAQSEGTVRRAHVAIEQVVSFDFSKLPEARPNA
jgi:nitroimidazol reductase NimA-like FMN-containing flavoprotein (pyridoxamine 5'-phosphate oxidase superfamily)